MAWVQVGTIDVKGVGLRLEADGIDSWTELVLILYPLVMW